MFDGAFTMGNFNITATHWGKNGKFSLKIEKSEVKIGPIFGLRPLVDTLAYPKIPFLGQDLVWFGLEALLKMWKISEYFTLSNKLLEKIAKIGHIFDDRGKGRAKSGLIWIFIYTYVYDKRFLPKNYVAFRGVLLLFSLFVFTRFGSKKSIILSQTF